ncbi:hypothetical protein NEF87_000348 [Candidatus Lokiarchaeum ossiferum]|uniref:Lumazine-binding protein n=1 Tax=Candidatus Lokiarchaeum ossiferum TaxID=2951803 RepID=A0ABY6HKL5_9ARCH|nr:hypothetical protein NEF87_000348 [Candidatus Lokiarchaeum sp. B-35]
MQLSIKQNKSVLKDLFSFISLWREFYFTSNLIILLAVQKNKYNVVISMKIEEKIKKTALNYVEGWYSADSKRMEKALHSKLVKRRFVSPQEIWDVNTPWMIEATEEGRGKIDDINQGKKEVTILDYYNNIASVKIISDKFVDYLHMVFIQGEWKIVDVLWDFVK